MRATERKRDASPPGGDCVIRDKWHVVAIRAALPAGEPLRTRLLERDLIVRLDGARVRVVGPSGRELPVLERFGFVWTSLGTPTFGLFEIPECEEPDRRTIFAGGIGVHTSAPRAVENFLDMGHFPFVHAGFLGIEPFTEVKTYEVSMSVEEGVRATRCSFYQPKAQASATEPFEVSYVYRVPHPYAALLYKDAPHRAPRADVIGLFLQPVDEEHVIGHVFGSFLDDVNSDVDIRIFSQLIFAQDKPILENQRPRKLPLDLRAELPVRSDASSIAYRRWLHACGVTYGTTADR